MFTSKVLSISRLLQELNSASRQPKGTTSVIQAITSEGLAQGPYVATRVGVEPATFRIEGTTQSTRMCKKQEIWKANHLLQKCYFRFAVRNQSCLT